MLLASLALISLLSVSRLNVEVQDGRAASIPLGAQRVPMLSLRLAASCDKPVTVESLTLHHGGMGDREDLTSVYVMQGERRITRGRTFASSNGDLTLTLPPGFAISACQSIVLTVLANFSANAAAAGEHRLLLSAPSDIDAGEAVVSIVTPTGSDIRRTVGEPQGSIAVEFLPLLSRVSYGDRRTVARLRLTADGAYDQLLDSLTLTNDGSAQGNDLQHLSLETQRGTSLARLSALEGDAAPFVFDPPFLLEKGQTVRLDVRSDVRASRRRTIDFLLEETSDLVSHRSFGRR